MELNKKEANKILQAIASASVYLANDREAIEDESLLEEIDKVIMGLDKSFTVLEQAIATS